MNNLETMTENMEKEMIRWTNNVSSQFSAMQTTILDLQKRNELLMSKNKTIENNISLKTRLIELCQKKIIDLTEKVEQTKPAVSTSSDVSNAVDLQIADLRQTINEEIKNNKDEILEKIENLQNRIRSEKKEERTSWQSEHDDDRKEMSKISEALKKKAPQSELDKLIAKVNTVALKLDQKQMLSMLPETFPAVPLAPTTPQTTTQHHTNDDIAQQHNNEMEKCNRDEHKNDEETHEVRRTNNSISLLVQAPMTLNKGMMLPQSSQTWSRR